MRDDNRVLVLTMGGTIAATGAGGGTGVAPRLTADDLLAGVPQLQKESMKLEGRSFRQVPSGEITLRDILALAEEIKRETENGVKGIVITQGTDTIEETSFALDCLLQVDVPVVVTGAMRNPELPGADGPANLYAAVKVAADPACRGLGVLVVMNDEIHAARWVRKGHTANTDAFVSPSGPIGWMAEGEPYIAMHPKRGPVIDVPTTAEPPFVPIIPVALGDEGQLLRAVEQLGCDGLVLEAMGGGHARQILMDVLSRLAREIPVILSSRVGAGTILKRTYNFPGSETDLLAKGLIHGGALIPSKARILLSLLLMAKADRETIINTFARF